MPDLNHSVEAEDVKQRIIRSIKGDERALTTLINEFSPPIAVLVKSITRCDEATGEVVCQTMEIWRKNFHLFVGEQTYLVPQIRTWLKTTAKRLALVWLNANPPKPSVPEWLLARVAATGSDPLDRLLQEDRRSQIETCLSEFKEPDAKVFDLWLAKVKLDAIADCIVFGRDRNKVERFVKIAVKQLRSCLATRGYGIVEGW